MRRRADASADPEVRDSNGALPVGRLRVGADHVQAGPTWSATLAVTGYPAEVGAAWLEPLTSWPGVMDVAVQVVPMAAAPAAGRVRRRRIRMESSRRFQANRGALEDPLIEAANQDAADLADKIARGESRLFTTTITITVYATSRAGLRMLVADLQAHAASMLLETHVMTWQQVQGWMSTLPIVANHADRKRIMDTDALAAAGLVASPDVPAPLSSLFRTRPRPGRFGVLAGMNLVSGGAVASDRWGLDNHNQVVLARSGAGKSYAVKVAILREMYSGVKVSVIDPEREYLELARRVGGTVIELGAPDVRVNPMALSPGDPDAFRRRCLAVHTLVEAMLVDPLTPAQRTALDQAIILTYARAGITDDPATWTRAVPQLHDLAEFLGQAADHDAANVLQPKHAGSDADHHLDAVASGVLAAGLTPWITGSFRGLFDSTESLDSAGDGASRTRHPGLGLGQSQLTVWSTRLLAEELRPVGMLLAIAAVWQSIDRRVPPDTGQGDAGGQDTTVQERLTVPGDRYPRPETGPHRQLVVVDEASLLLSEPAGARFLARLAKTSRKRDAGLVLITPDVIDLLGSELGQVILANSATVLLLRQAPQEIAQLARACALSPGEASFLVSARRGQGLLLADARVPIDIVASPHEHAIAAARPDQLQSVRMDALDDEGRDEAGSNE